MDAEEEANRGDDDEAESTVSVRVGLEELVELVAREAGATRAGTVPARPSHERNREAKRKCEM